MDEIRTSKNELVSPPQVADILNKENCEINGLFASSERLQQLAH